ncbi:MAG: MraY family glycosyltransferase [Pseudomonadota bacterium]
MLVLKLLLLSLVITRVSAGIGFRVGLIDTPAGRKQHQGSVALTGGIAIFLTILAGTYLFKIQPYTYPMLWVAAAIFLVGIFDDLKHIRASVRLGISFMSGVALATLGGIVIVNVGNLLAMGDIPLLWLSVPLTALAVAGLSNACNMIDGIDGLAAGSFALPLLVLYLLALQAGHPMAPALLLMLVPLAVFLCFNLGPNNKWMPKIFLGDAGSVTLGFLLTASLVYFSQGERAIILPVTALWLVTVPLMDMLATMLRRHRLGTGIMRADRLHVHHTLMALGLESRQTLSVLLAYASACAMLGLALERIPEYLSLLLYFLLFCGHCVFVLKAGSVKRGRVSPSG